MEHIDRSVELENDLDETHFGSRPGQSSPQIQDEWIGKDLVGGVDMDVESSQGHEEIHLIDNSRNITLEQGSGSMVNSNRKEEDKMARDNDEQTLQQPNAGIQEGREDGVMDGDKETRSASLFNSRIIQSGCRDTSRGGAGRTVDDSRVSVRGAVDNSRVSHHEQGDRSRIVPLECENGPKGIQQESRVDSRAMHVGNMDGLRTSYREDQNLSPGQTEENCPSDMALSQDTGDGTEVFYRMNPESTNGTSRFLPSHAMEDGDGTEEEQAAFVRELENFFKERNMEFKPPKFYGENLNCLKLWRAVTRLGGYEQVTSCKLWRQVGESFNPPKTCTTVSWSFRGFYEKALLEYERYKFGSSGGDGGSGSGGTPLANNVQADVLLPVGGESQACATQASGSGRARRDAAARAMQGWHSQRLLSNGMLKRKKTSSLERAVKVARTKGANPQMDVMVVDAGPQADWVKVNVHKMRDCFEVYALVPGLLREEVRVQCDPAGRLVISGDPEQPDNPWGVTRFKKVITLPSRIDSHQTSAVVTLHGQLFVRVPFEQSDL
uniref:ARID domain-containing protein n=1 Tax=Araucaria cunninghamii TaxID=56994 RepID=A0A0D6R0I3_ARACU